MDALCLDSPLGAELDNISEEELDEVFVNDHGESLAERYIMRRWKSDRNPLLPRVTSEDHKSST